MTIKSWDGLFWLSAVALFLFNAGWGFQQEPEGVLYLPTVGYFPLLYLFGHLQKGLLNIYAAFGADLLKYHSVFVG